ncbi:MAG: hypothetical protein QM692_06535 [Thermomicrobiales bacterium]
MSAPPARWRAAWLWVLPFAALAVFTAWRMSLFTLTVPVSTPGGVQWLPNTFATVDHPFHVARAETLWRELGQGHVLRWVGQHQGGYPVEFYPLGEAWLEVLLRGLSLGSLQAAGAHTLALVVIFLLPGAAFFALGRLAGLPPAVALLALALQIALPGGWYHGGYTELVQWGLVTNVAGATAAFLMLPCLFVFCRSGGWLALCGAALTGTWAVYSNPRSLIGVAAVALGCLVVMLLPKRRQERRGSSGTRWARGDGPHPQLLSRCAGEGSQSGSLWGEYDAPTQNPALTFGEESPSPAHRERGWGEGSPAHILARLTLVTVLTALLAAPQLLSLLRFGGLYTFVHYSGYATPGEYLTASAQAVTPWVLALAIVGGVLAWAAPSIQGAAGFRGAGDVGATRAVFAALVIYTLLTAAISFVPALAAAAAQLETTRLMPLQRLLTLYLAAYAIWWISTALLGRWQGAAAGVVSVAALMLVVLLTRPPAEPVDPASPVVPVVGLYPVTMSAQPAQVDLQAAVEAADRAAAPGTALLVLGSALSWHQPLWSPLWTARPLYYDNWLWYWHPDQVGTPGYRPAAGNHYPDPEQTLTPEYLAAHGIGGVVVTGPAAMTATMSPLLAPVAEGGAYAAYVVRSPVTTITFDGQNAETSTFANQRLTATSPVAAPALQVRANWFPRWQGANSDGAVAIARGHDGSISVTAAPATSQLTLEYAVLPLDWLARGLALLGLLGLAGYAVLALRRGGTGYHPVQRPAVAGNADGE